VHGSKGSRDRFIFGLSAAALGARANIRAWYRAGGDVAATDIRVYPIISASEYLILETEMRFHLDHPHADDSTERSTLMGLFAATPLALFMRAFRDGERERAGTREGGNADRPCRSA
jgi:hypothetical protein